jgi:autotransporter-associated beta strand protein
LGALLAGACLGAASAHATDGTWTGATDEGWTNGTNWSSTPTANTVPDNTATFSSSTHTFVEITPGASINTIQFDATAGAYLLDLQFGTTFNINGTGIVNNSLVQQTLGGFGTLQFNNSSTAGSIKIDADTLRFNNTSTAGSASISSFDLRFNNASTAGSATIFSFGGQIIFADSSTAANATFTNRGSIDFGDSSTAGNATITNSEFISADYRGTTFHNSSTAGNATITTNFQAFTLFKDTSTGGNARFITNAGDAFDLSLLTSSGMTAGSIEGAGAFYLGSKQLTVGSNNLSTTVSGIVSDCQFIADHSCFRPATGGSLVKVGTGTLTLSGVNDYTGGTTILAGTLAVSGFLGTLGASTNAVTVNGATAILDIHNPVTQDGGVTLQGGGTIQGGGLSSSGTFDMQSGTVSATLAGTGSVSKTTIGTVTFSGPNTYTGTTTVNAGTLEVDGSIATSSLTTVNSGATLTGAGTLGTTQINAGAVLAPGMPGSPGTSLAVSGNLAFQSGAIYLVQINPTSASSTNVSGTATLAGNVLAAFAPGSYVHRQYTILHAATLDGTFGALGTVNLPPGFQARLDYTPTDVVLDLSAAIPTGGLGGNQQNVATALNNFFSSGGALPPGFAAVFGLSGADLANGLSQLSGEAGTGAQAGGLRMTNSFLSLLLDPYPDGAGGGFGPAMPFAPERAAFTPEIASAYAKALKAPRPRKPDAPRYAEPPRYNVWGAAYGGTNNTSGDPAGTGSHDTTSHAGAFAAGLDYRVSADTVVGFALAGGGNSWSLSGGLGGGRSDVFQAGVYGARRFGPAYVSGALSYSSFWTTTNRTVMVAGTDQLTGMFDPRGIGGRLEGGYRLNLTAADLAPYAALQVQSFFVPAYSETATSGSPQFALAYNAQTATAVRSELGSRAERTLRLADGTGLRLFGRLAWAHDWQSNPALGVTFLGLPGASFVVNGATPPSDLVLVTAGAEWHWRHGWTLLGKLDGEFANRSQTYTGTGKVQYTW